MKRLPGLSHSFPTAGLIHRAWWSRLPGAANLPLALLALLALMAPNASFAAAATPSPANPANGTTVKATRSTSAAAGAASDEAAYEFLTASLMAGDGMLSEALAAFDEASKVHPESAYIHLEHSQLLARMAQAARVQAAQSGYLRKAADEIGKARQLAPNNLDVMKGVGLVYLDLASQDPSALPTALEALEAVYRRDPDDMQNALNLGRLYLDQRQTGKAADVLRDVIHRSPQQRTAYALLVEALLRDEKAKEAEVVLGQILDLEPAAIEARLSLAELESRRNDYAAVLATLSAAPEPDRSDSRVQRQIAWAYYLTGDIDHALATAEPLLKNVQPATADPDEMQLLLLKGLVLAAQGHNQEAADLLRLLRGARPNDSALATVLSKVLERSGHPDQAAQVLQDLDANLAKAGKQDEEHQARLELAQVYFDAKQWDRVTDTLQPLLHLGPTDAAREPATLLAVDALVQRKSYDEALRVLDGAAMGKAGVPSASVATKRAEVLFRAGREREATHQLEEVASSKDPLDTLAAAETYQRLEKYSESIPLLERLLAGKGDAALPPGSAKAARFLLGAADERTGKREQAVAEFRRLLGVDPDFHAALNYLGYMFAERGENLEEARTLVAKAVALDPDNGAYLDSLGWVYFRLGRYEDARSALERAIRLETADGTVEEHLGDVYGALGKPDQAGAAYRRAIELESADPAKADEVRKKLEGLGGGTRRP